MLWLASTAAVEAELGNPVRITYHEPVSGLRIEMPGAAIGKPAEASRSDIEFSAFGRQFELDLERNDRLYEQLRSDPRLATVALPVFRGTARGLTGSWARIALVDGIPIGAVWDGSELYLVDTAENFGVAATAADRSVVVVRASDVRIPTDTVLPPANASQTAAIALAGGASGTAYASSPAALVGALPIGLVLDAGFSNMVSNPVDYALALANVVDGIFVAQLGLHLDVAHVEVYDAEPDPFSSSVDRILLDQLADLKRENSRLRPLGLAHLLTRNELGGNVVGIANIDKVCDDRDAVGLSRAVGGITTALIMAHEIGHNFGAYHDGENGSICASTPTTYLMSATINHARQFSHCSIRSMTPTIAGAGCKTTLPQSDVQLIPPAAPGPVWYGEPVLLDYRIHNAGTDSTLDNLARFSSNNPEPVWIHDVVNQSCATTGGTAGSSCDLQSIGAGQTVPLSVSVTPRTTERITIEASVTAANDVDISNNSAALELVVRPATDLHAFVDSDDGRNYAQPGSTLSLRAGAINEGDFESASSLRISTDAGNRLTVPDGCVRENAARLRCELGVLLPGEQKSVGFELHVNPTVVLGLSQTRLNRVYVEASSTLHDIDLGSNWGTMFIRLVGSIHDLELGLPASLQSPQSPQSPQSLIVGQTRTFEAEIRNNGPDTAPDVVIATYGSGLRFSEWSIGRGDCAIEETWLNCRIDYLDSGDHVDIAVTYMSDLPDLYRFGMQVYSEHGVDTNYDNGWQQFDVVVRSDTPVPAPAQGAPAPGGGGGGNFLWPGFLLLLAMALRRARLSPATGRSIRWSSVLRGHDAPRRHREVRSADSRVPAPCRP